MGNIVTWVWSARWGKPSVASRGEKRESNFFNFHSKRKKEKKTSISISHSKNKGRFFPFDIQTERKNTKWGILSIPFQWERKQNGESLKIM